MRVVLLIVVALVFCAGAAKAQGFCPTYATALNLTQAALMETVIGDVASRLFNDPTTLPWFTGTNNKGNTNFITNSAALSGLATGLIAFFGKALSCNAAEFTGAGKYANPSANMKGIHSGFNKPVTKAAYEAFNIHVIDSLASFGVANADLATVAGVLDGFRGPRFAANADVNTVCQASDCYDSPFRVDASETAAGKRYFAPAMLKVPVGGAILFRNNGSIAHKPVQGNSATCTPTSGGFDLSIPTAGSTATTPKQNTASSINYYCSIHCASGQNGQYTVAALTASPSSTSTSTGSAASISVAFFAALAVVLAMLF